MFFMFIFTQKKLNWYIVHNFVVFIAKNNVFIVNYGQKQKN